MPKKIEVSTLDVQPLTPSRWREFVDLFGKNGACGGCWCMTPRLTRRDYEAKKGEKNRRAMQQLVKRGPPPGVLGFVAGAPVAWCQIAPRTEFALLAGSRVLAPVDAEPVWAITCVLVKKEWRGKGLTVPLLDGAVKFAGKHGARIVEGYPVEPVKHPMPAVFAWTGILSSFVKAGFVEVERRSKTRPIVRRRIGPAGRGTSRRAATGP